MADADRLAAALRYIDEQQPADPLARLKADPIGALRSAFQNKVEPIINNAKRTFATGGGIGDILRAYGEAGAPANAAMLRGMGTPYQETTPVNTPPSMAPNTSYGNLGDASAQMAGGMIGDPLNAIPLAGPAARGAVAAGKAAAPAGRYAGEQLARGLEAHLIRSGGILPMAPSLPQSKMQQILESGQAPSGAPQITKKAKEFFAEGDLPKPKENHVRIFRGSWEKEPKYIVEENPKHDVYGGVFGSSGLKVAKSHGNEGLHYTDIPQDKILTHYDLNYEIPYEKTKAALLKAQPHLADDPELFDDVYKIVVEDAGQDLRNVNDDLINKAFGPYGPEVENEVQRIRGQVSKNLGYQAVEMVDEHGGGTYLVSPGAEFQTLEKK